MCFYSMRCALSNLLVTGGNFIISVLLLGSACLKVCTGVRFSVVCEQIMISLWHVNRELFNCLISMKGS